METVGLRCLRFGILHEYRALLRCQLGGKRHERKLYDGVNVGSLHQVNVVPISVLGKPVKTATHAVVAVLIDKISVTIRQ